MSYLKQLEIKYIKTKRKNPVQGQVIGPDILIKTFSDIECSDKEKVVAVYLDARLVINSFEIISIGGTDFSLITPREIFKGALLTNSLYFAVIHNHPSGDPTPSINDRLIYDKIQAQASVMEINCLDFIIIGDGKHWSAHSESLADFYPKH